MKKIIVLLGVLTSAILPLKATEYLFMNFDTTFTTHAGGPWVGDSLDLELGGFTGGFVANQANLADWGASWYASGTGYFDGSGPESMAVLNLADNSVMTPGSQLSLWVFDTKSPGGEWALYTDPSWITISNTDSGLGGSFDFTAQTVAVFGSFDLGAHVAATSVASAIPEPSTWACFAGVAALGFAAYRKRRAGVAV